jgi:hypothetical protein
MDTPDEANTENKSGLFQNMKKGSKLLYNTTIGEVKNGRFPIIDSAYRTFYRKSFNPNNPKGTEVFPKNEGYYKLGGKHNSRRKRKNKTKKTKKTKKTNNKKTRKNKKKN